MKYLNQSTNASHCAFPQTWFVAWLPSLPWTYFAARHQNSPCKYAPQWLSVIVLANQIQQQVWEHFNQKQCTVGRFLKRARLAVRGDQTPELLLVGQTSKFIWFGNVGTLSLSRKICRCGTRTPSNFRKYKPLRHWLHELCSSTFETIAEKVRVRGSRVARWCNNEHDMHAPHLCNAACLCFCRGIVFIQDILNPNMIHGRVDNKVHVTWTLSNTCALVHTPHPTLSPCTLHVNHTVHSTVFTTPNTCTKLLATRLKVHPHINFRVTTLSHHTLQPHGFCSIVYNCWHIEACHNPFNSPYVNTHSTLSPDSGCCKIMLQATTLDSYIHLWSNARDEPTVCTHDI